MPGRVFGKEVLPQEKRPSEGEISGSRANDEDAKSNLGKLIWEETIPDFGEI